ncbi:hypothetical protein [Sphingomonas sp. KR3-1]|uniref:hypothetical protein n=1 Tax=Sphingomonas sp. KR3-1 TaxID=3156611 RepID=UPI0032B42A90
MAFWNVDLTTEDGAMGAAQLGGYAGFVAAALTAFGLAMLLVAFGTSSPAATALVLGPVVVELVVFLAAGFRLRAGRGLVWGSVAALLLLIDLLPKIATFSIPVIIIDTVLLIGLITGLRGALALRRGQFDTGEAAAIFE